MKFVTTRACAHTLGLMQEVRMNEGSVLDALLEGLVVASEAEMVAVTSDGADDESLLPIAAMLENIRLLLNMDVAFVGSFIDGQRVFTHLASEAELPVGPGFSVPLEETYCQRVIDGRLPPVIPDSSLLPAARDLQATREFGIASYLTAPVILKDGTVYGTVCCLSHVPRPFLSAKELSALQTVADFVSASVEGAGAIECIDALPA
ncbi:Histidine kinase [Burkholderiales bacterium 8X]|nr:Histidine kinase [Burkholderiales bacterium 8X]